ncbi:hypothetical protein K502DRAFT_339782 [Neoconidiobolus thromboides FSU 785]|nr:hypothetical protein K502DRAFT_339782 [Neoconidiobolus thromboides FSU 785]
MEITNSMDKKENTPIITNDKKYERGLSRDAAFQSMSTDQNVQNNLNQGQTITKKQTEAEKNSTDTEKSPQKESIQDSNIKTSQVEEDNEANSTEQRPKDNLNQDLNTSENQIKEDKMKDITEEAHQTDLGQGLSINGSHPKEDEVDNAETLDLREASSLKIEHVNDQGTNSNGSKLLNDKDESPQIYKKTQTEIESNDKNGEIEATLSEKKEQVEIESSEKKENNVFNSDKRAVKRGIDNNNLEENDQKERMYLKSNLVNKNEMNMNINLNQLGGSKNIYQNKAPKLVRMKSLSTSNSQSKIPLRSMSTLGLDKENKTNNIQNGGIKLTRIPSSNDIPTRDLEGDFMAAIEARKRLITNDDRAVVEMYAYYQQATIGQNTTRTPNELDYCALEKWGEWYNLREMSKEEAKINFIRLVARLCGRKKSRN